MTTAAIANNARTFATRLVEEDKIDAMVGGTTTGSTLAMIPVFEDAKIPFISLAGAIQIIEPVRKWVFKTPHTDRMACEKIFADLKHRNLTTIAHDLGHRRVRQVDARPMRRRGAEGRHQDRHEETYGPRDSDMTPQLTNIKQQGRRAGGGQSGLRPRSGDRDAQLPAAWHQGAALSEPRRLLRSSSSISPGPRPKACACRRRRCWSPRSCRPAIRKSRSS